MKELKDIRKRLQWTQERLGAFLGYAGRKAVSNLETGREEMGGSARRLLDLLRLYGADAAKLWHPGFTKRIKRILKGEPDGDKS